MRKPVASGPILLWERAVRDPTSIRSLLFRVRALSEGAWTVLIKTFADSIVRELQWKQIEVMAILFAVVARGTTILAKHAWCGGNFLEVTEQILAKIPSENNKLTYSHGNYLFHYICQDRIVYLCITDDDFERSRAFNFLNEIRKRFQTTYGSRAQTALPYAMNSEFSSVLAAQLVRYFSRCSILIYIFCITLKCHEYREP
ncbi:Vesicle-Associated Membrane Protein 7 [Manis pentadactyla]|nr:Vesicle-Associated Membrane Protein 7 [Manis pentadactyla]